MVSITLDHKEAAEVFIHTVPADKFQELATLMNAEIIPTVGIRYCKFEIGEVMITLFED